MESISDKINLMELEFQFQDDNTSCSSSTFSISEDIDDLRLGAEANTFSTKYEDDDNNNSRPVYKFEIMKEHRSSYEQEVLNYTISTITSIPDLIDAREGSPEDLLLGLGFASFEGEESHRSILSRFYSAPPGNEEEADDPHYHHHDALGPTVHHGIMKTQEWLANQDNMNDSTASPPSNSKELTGSNKSNGSSTTHTQSKRLPPQKKRHRWSKSRQSSFEHLLPNLVEEENIPEAEGVKSDSSSTSLKDKHIPPIRESSQEKENYSPQENNSKVLENELFQKLHKLEKQQKFDRDAELHILTDLCTTSPHRLAFLSQFKSDKKVESLENTEEFGKSEKMVLMESSPIRLSPWQQIGRKNLMSMMKVDSFELEEIVSNDGRLSPDVARLQQKPKHNNLDVKRKQKTCATRALCTLHTRSSSEEDVSSASHSDTSSGFDEGLEEVVTPVPQQVMHDAQHQKEDVERVASSKSTQLPSYADNLTQSASVMSVSNYETSSLWQKFDDFCSLRSRIACASGVAEYALRLRKIQAQSCSLRATSCSNIQEIGYGNSVSSPLHHSINGNSPSTRQFSWENDVDIQCHCEVDHSISPKRKSRSWSQKNFKKPYFYGGKRGQVPNGSKPSLNFNNNSIKQKFKPDRSRLFRYPSMPTLHLTATSPPCRKSSCQSYFSCDANSTTCPETSLMSTISDVTHLSSQSSSIVPKDRVRKTELSSSRDAHDKWHHEGAKALTTTKTIKPKLLNGFPSSIATKNCYNDDGATSSPHNPHILSNNDQCKHALFHESADARCICADDEAQKSTTFNWIHQHKSTTR